MGIVIAMGIAIATGRGARMERRMEVKMEVRMRRRVRMRMMRAIAMGTLA
jgi:hypothetical protein